MVLVSSVNCPFTVFFSLMVTTKLSRSRISVSENKSKTGGQTVAVGPAVGTLSSRWRRPSSRFHRSDHGGLRGGGGLTAAEFGGCRAAGLKQQSAYQDSHGCFGE